jgi:hypothetical protein
MNKQEVQVAQRGKATVEVRTKVETNRLLELASAKAAAAEAASQYVSETHEALRLTSTEEAYADALCAADLACIKYCNASVAFKAALDALTVEKQVIAALSALAADENP